VSSGGGGGGDAWRRRHGGRTCNVSLLFTGKSAKSTKDARCWRRWAGGKERVWAKRGPA